MRVQPAERTSTKLGRGSRHAPVTSGWLAEGPDGPGRTKPRPVPVADATPALPDRNAAYALLAQQCRSKVDSLAPRQRDVLAGLVAGCSNKQIACSLGISHRTIEIYRAGMMDRLKARTLAHALHIAFVAGLTPLDTMSFGNG